MAITVMAAGGGGYPSLAVKVLTGAAAAQTGQWVQRTGGVTSAAITPSATGSLVYGAYQVLNGAPNTWPYTPVAAAQVISDASSAASGSNMHEAVNFRSVSTTTGGTPVTLGVTAQGGEGSSGLVLLEILKAAGMTLAEDASSPAPVPASGSTALAQATQLSTAAFTPPAGALLVAMTSDGVGTGSPVVADTSGLAWTRQVQAVSGAYSASAWTAQVPVTAPAGIAEDASTPAAVHVPSGTTGTGTTAAFSPPAGSLVVVAAAVAYQSGTGTTGSTPLSCSDSLGNSYAAGASANGTLGNVALFTYYYASAPGAVTVTVTNSNKTTAITQVAPRVLTGAAASQAGAGSGSGSGSTDPVTGSIATTRAGSWVIAAETHASSYPSQPLSGTVITDLYADATGATRFITAGRLAAATVTPGPASIGWTTGNPFSWTWAALEILPAASSPGNPAVTWGTPHQLITAPNDFTGWNPAANVGQPH